MIVISEIKRCQLPHSTQVFQIGKHDRTEVGAETLVLSSRQSILELALQHGKAIVPVFAFGTSDHFDRLPPRGWFAGARRLPCALLVPMGACGAPIPRWAQAAKFFLSLS